jgi:predicted small lipoprotein YifL
MKYIWRYQIGILLILTLAGCGQKTAASIPTATISPTATLIPPTQAPANQAIMDARKCPTTQFASTAGDLSFTSFGLPPVSPLGFMLPPDLPTNKPYEIVEGAPSGDNNLGTRAPGPDIKVMGYDITICNTGTKAHSLRSITLKVASVQSATGTQQDVGQECSTPYPNPTGGCGGNPGQTFNTFQMSWPATVSIGTTPSAIKQESSAEKDIGKVWDILPVTLLPGQGYEVQPVITSIPDGIYTFTIGVQTEEGTFFSNNATFSIFFAAHPVAWDGFACAGKPALQALMQANKKYICAKV